MQLKAGYLLAFLVLSCCCLAARARGTVPTFTRMVSGQTLTFAGQDPAKAGTTVIPTVLVPIRLTFAGKTTALDAAGDVPRLLKSPLFAKYDFGTGEKTQYGDALLDATFAGAKKGHTLLGTPHVEPVTINVPAGRGYLLHAGRSGRSFAVVDSEYVEQQLFRKIPNARGKLVIAVAHDTAFYALGDATVCCTWGTHGVDPTTGNSFVLGSYLHDAPAIVAERDIQPLTQQLAEFLYDPLHDPGNYFYKKGAPGNFFTPWKRPVGDGRCGAGVGTDYFLLEPTDTSLKNNFPSSTPYIARTQGADYHLQNVALLNWYLGDHAKAGPYSFPNRHALKEPAKPCQRRTARAGGEQKVAVTPVAHDGIPNGHWLIGYWTGSRFRDGKPFPIRDVPPQWDVILVAFAPPAEDAPEGTMRFTPPQGITPDELKLGIAYLRSRGKKVMISLGGGGKYFKLDAAKDIPNFVSSVAGIVKQYGFDGVDIDFESPSLELVPGDTDFKKPVTPSVVNLIAGLRELHKQFGPGFMISLVPEGTQISAGLVSYGGQFGSYLPLVYALRDILSFVDVQEYNTPPLEGLDGNIYQTHTADYDVAMSELLLHGFDVAGDPDAFFPPLPADKIAVGFLVRYDKPGLVSQTMQYLVTGEKPPGVSYKLRQPRGYPAMLGAMFWTIDADRNEQYRYSNLIGPQLHRYPKAN
ncbi:MAG: glycosyl hydrolase family 18 protein [Rhodanobacteraceae bacterium]